ncbi:hypothetical protein E1287_07150 [Actinomadura sp. KC06]|nr:hypothetical protein E1287_07150 [Actinomadura sp. KC06]
MVAGGIEQLLADAHASGDKKLERAAAKASTAIDALVALYEPWLAEKKEAEERAAKLAEVEARAEQLRAQLEAAQAEVAALTGKPTRKSNAPSMDRERSQAIRAWAAREGIKVHPRGRIPGEVVERYDAVHPGAPDGA